MGTIILVFPGLGFSQQLSIPVQTSYNYFPTFIIQIFQDGHCMWFDKSIMSRMGPPTMCDTEDAEMS